MKMKSLFTKIIFFSGISLSIKAKESVSSVLKDTIHSGTTESSTNNQQIFTITGITNSKEVEREENGKEKTQDHSELNNFVEKLNDRIEGKFDEATAQLHSIDHQMNMLDNRINFKLEKLSNVIEEVDQRLEVMNRGINENLTSRRFTPMAYITTNTPRPRHKWGRKLLKYLLIILSTMQSIDELSV